VKKSIAVIKFTYGNGVVHHVRTTKADNIYGGVEAGHRSASVCHLGAIALRTGLALEWHAAKEQFAGEHAPEASRFLAREMRPPYDYSLV
jgi:hypothetical protein